MLPRLNVGKWCLVALSLAVVTPSIAGAQGVESPRVPLRTSLAELATIRAEYADAYGRKDVASIAGMYMADAVLVNADGSVAKGTKAITAALKASSKDWTTMRIDSDTVGVSLGTAWDSGTLHVSKAGGGEDTMRYLAVLRHGLNGWKLASVVSTPITAKP